ncbi:iron-siderophore ABC transporter substrate-binding protein [Pseudonocardia sp. KRD291]|uniref:iron-siderophore ABC transporter substrate-binding protein n=1 Tax=Pseudonocardia sp. KRD291 TaxID=2792007 RepID=UPI001C49E3F1|nr:iron-siderophore ABC transporter substrate-binding protein [Pseudonocardia sp. KRD291]MBW0106721.1 iron-siderophore ABC transporter substrate-binding protein [Pseudonocardia sp. KRD291]
MIRSLAAVSALVLLLLTGCSAGPAASASGPSLDTIFGPVQVPAAPQRVVALGWGDAEAALAVGVAPVGASDWLAFGGEGVGPWAAGRYPTPPQITGTLDIDYEQVAALRPDVILWTRSDNTEDTYRRLSRIAPTVAAPAAVANAYGTTWDQQARLVASAVGRPAEGEALVDRVEQKFAAVRAKHPSWAGRTATIGVRNADRYAAYVPGGTRADFVTALGFVINPEIVRENARNFSVTLGTENVGRLDADIVLLSLIGASGDQVRNDPLVQRMPSFRDGRFIVLEDKTVARAFSAATALGTEYALDTTVPLIEKALPGT